MLEDSLKVGTVLDKIADKLGTKNLTLFSRTKSRLGRTDKVLQPSDSLYELSEKYRKKQKPYEIFVLIGSAGDSQVLASSADRRMSAPVPPVSLDFLDGANPDPLPSSAPLPHPLSLSLPALSRFSFRQSKNSPLQNGTKGPQ
eukprot:Phypoly_transcript_17486.p1 GENE.Phypoly_transcript_17486~~Phypoly_transcript_17486.p1  ORF type:complete len:143 (+),score=31.28 Phypoly_transcript_17486:280-708(+)